MLRDFDLVVIGAPRGFSIIILLYIHAVCFKRYSERRPRVVDP